MKNFLLLLICCLIFSCSRNDDPIKYCNGKIIGFDPCSFNNEGISKGYVIISSDKKLTLKTFNLPDSIYTFKKEYFLDYLETSYFPISIRDSFPITIKYTIADKNQIVYAVCLDNINTSEFNNAIQVITISASKPKK
jgi:hypothetical protein